MATSYDRAREWRDVCGRVQAPAGTLAFPAGPIRESFRQAQGRQDFKTLLRQILNEQISLQDGVNSRKVSKREAITRRLIIGAMKGDSRDLHALFKLAEQTGEFDDARNADNLEVIVRWMSDAPVPEEKRFPVISQLNRE